MKSLSTVINYDEWQKRLSVYRSTVEEYTSPYRMRRSRGESHPIMDFLFTYYSFSIGRLETWHPGINYEIENTGERPKVYHETHYTESKGRLYLDINKLTPERRSSIKWMITLLVNTQDRSPIYGCYGMHEWAMVYKGIDVRHKETTPLRLTQEQTDAFVESRPITCSHFDAFRFFTPEAQPFNKLQPNKNAREEFEQPGCVHANMDLYKWAYKCMPWVGSDFLWKTFLLALKMRELDMRAAPYDITKFGYEPIKVETTEGRKEYEAIQREMAEEAKPLRAELINILKNLLAK